MYDLMLLPHTAHKVVSCCRHHQLLSEMEKELTAIHEVSSAIIVSALLVCIMHHCVGIATSSEKRHGRAEAKTR